MSSYLSSLRPSPEQLERFKAFIDKHSDAGGSEAAIRGAVRPSLFALAVRIMSACVCTCLDNTLSASQCLCRHGLCLGWLTEGQAMCCRWRRPSCISHKQAFSMELCIKRWHP